MRDNILLWHERFAKNNGISLAEAKQWLVKGELSELKWSVQEYIRAGESLDPKWAKALENASARVHINRYEALLLQLQQEAELLYGNQLDALDGLLKHVYAEGYYHNAFELQRGFHIGYDLQHFNENQLQAVLSKPWTTDGRTFRDRCWQNKEALVAEVKTRLTQGIIRGEHPRVAAQGIAERFGVAKSKAARLTMTESAYFSAASQRDCYNDLGVAYFEVVETLDATTCVLCGELDGKVLPMQEYESGVTAPPFHPWCRGCTAPYFDDNHGERIARNADGEVYYVPTEMKYSDWKATFVDGGTKKGLTATNSGGTISLTEREKWAINEYIGSASYPLNAALREGALLTPQQSELALQLDSALAHMPVYTGTVYRSITDFGIDDIDAFWAEYVPNAIIKFPSYTSSATQVYDNSFSIQYVINGKRGRDLRAYNTQEHEILFQRNTECRVIRVENGTIYMEEV